ncbi:MAG: hypothetical protein ABFD50_00910 [Smithella sp.]
MKQFKTIVIPEHTSEKLVTRTCDLCGLESKSSDWDAGVYEVEETEVKLSVRQKNGKSYPDGGWGTQYEIDLCPVCFTSKLVPWLKSQGADIEPQKWDW